jgi:hypothetical protein
LFSGFTGELTLNPGDLGLKPLDRVEGPLQPRHPPVKALAIAGQLLATPLKSPFMPRINAYWNVRPQNAAGR